MCFIPAFTRMYIKRDENIKCAVKESTENGLHHCYSIKNSKGHNILIVHNM